MQTGAQLADSVYQMKRSDIRVPDTGKQDQEQASMREGLVQRKNPPIKLPNLIKGGCVLSSKYQYNRNITMTAP